MKKIENIKKEEELKKKEENNIGFYEKFIFDIEKKEKDEEKKEKELKLKNNLNIKKEEKNDSGINDIKYGEMLSFLLEPLPKN